MPSHLLPFLGVVILITLLPGPDMALGIRNGVRGGRRATWLTGLGCMVGLVVWATMSVLGLGALRSALGADEQGSGRMRLSTSALTVTASPSGARTPTRIWFRQGLISNLLNPKIALLFITLLPQFVAAHEPRTATTAELALTMLIVAALW